MVVFIFCLQARGLSVPGFPPRIMVLHSTSGGASWVRVRRFAPLAIVVLVMMGLLGLGVWSGFAESKRTRVAVEKLYLTRLHFEPWQRPQPVRASETWLPDNARVIGVVAGTHERAYALNSFSNVSQHVVNDVIDDTAVTVAHCPISGCTRVFSVANRAAPLEMSVGGWVGKRGLEPDRDSVMLLRVDETEYFQDTCESLDGDRSLPYAQAQFEETTWGEWRTAHPDTDVIAAPKPKK